MKNTHPFAEYKLKSILLIYYLPAYKEIHPSKMLRHFAEKTIKRCDILRCDILGETIRHIALVATFRESSYDILRQVRHFALMRHFAVVQGGQLRQSHNQRNSCYKLLTEWTRRRRKVLSNEKEDRVSATNETLRITITRKQSKYLK